MTLTTRFFLPLLLAATPFMPVQAEERRIEIALPQAEHDWVLSHMRRMLEAVADMQGAMAENSSGQRLKAIAKMTTHKKETHPDTLHELLPEGFTDLSKEMQKQWQALRHPDLPLSEQLETMEELLDTCNACHQTYRLSVKSDS